MYLMLSDLGRLKAIRELEHRKSESILDYNGVWNLVYRAYESSEKADIAAAEYELKRQQNVRTDSDIG